MPEQVEKTASFGKQRESRGKSSASGVAAADATLASLDVRLRELQARLEQAKTGEAYDWDLDLIKSIKKEIEGAEAEKQSATEEK